MQKQPEDPRAFDAEAAEREVERRLPGVSCDAAFDGRYYVVTIAPLASGRAVEVAEAGVARSLRGFRDAVDALLRNLPPWAARLLVPATASSRNATRIA